MSYYEICALQESGKGQTVYDSEQMVPYYTDGSLWVGFDDEVSLAIKIEWLVSEGYGGAMVWALPLDDFRQTCSKSNRKFPLLNTIKDGLIIAENGGTLTTPAIPTGMFTAVPTTSGPTKQGRGRISNKDREGVWFNDTGRNKFRLPMLRQNTVDSMLIQKIVPNFIIVKEE
uniref:Acidic mammalian chitinase-like protein n=1 Tax=Mytilus edulis TaxID=6550 RepID=A0A3S5X2N5_MYTED|nr:acidic mammalian chitinase-like protein [Mytilus edulis]